MLGARELACDGRCLHGAHDEAPRDGAVDDDRRRHGDAPEERRVGVDELREEADEENKRLGVGEIAEQALGETGARARRRRRVACGVVAGALVLGAVKAVAGLRGRGSPAAG